MPDLDPKIAASNKKLYERLVKNISNVAFTLVHYPIGHPVTEKQAGNLYQELLEIFKTDKVIAIHHGQNTFIVNDIEVIVNGPALAKIDRHFKNLKITDLEINIGLTEKELQNFLEIFAHSEETAKIYPDLNTACLKNNIKNVKSLQAAYIRVAKDVKDKLGGKSVGELKISQDEMNRLVSYLKGEVDLDPKESKTYQKIFKNKDMLSSLVEKIIVDSANQPLDKRKKLIIIAINQIGKYLAKQSTSESKQKENLKIMTELKESLSKSETFLSLSKNDPSLKAEVDNTLDKLKLLIKNQTLLSEYNNFKTKLEHVKEKIEKISPTLLEQLGEKNSPIANRKLLLEIKLFLEKIYSKKTLTENDGKKIQNLISEIKKIL